MIISDVQIQQNLQNNQKYPINKIEEYQIFIKFNYHKYQPIFIYKYKNIYKSTLHNIPLNLPSQNIMNIALFTKSWPRHNHNSILQKTISLIQSLINLNNKIVVCSDEQDYKIKQQIKQYPMELLDINAKKISLSLNNLTKLQFKPNIFIFDSVQSQQKYSAFLYNRWNKAARVLAINQLKGLQKWRKTNYKLVPNVLIPPDSYLSPQNVSQIFTQQQIHSISRCDYIFTSNQHTYHLLNKYMLKDKSTKYISQINYGFPLVQFMGQINQLRYRPYKNRQNFVFIGNFYNQSNQDCIFVLVNYIWPVIREQLPGVELHIYGTGGVTQQHYYKLFGQPANFSKEYSKKLGIQFKGIMKDPQSLSQYRALLYPCVFSTGTHMKILQSWFTHLPVVTTPIGAQGLFLQSYDPQFVGSFNSKTSYIFSSQRVYTQQQKKNAQMIKNYYNNRIINKNSLKFKFGGSYANFTYKDFIQNSIKIYKDQQYWKQCLKNAHQIIKTNQNDTHLQVVLKRALVSIEIATFEGRGRASYEEQWKRYTRSQEFNKKIRG